MNKTYLLEKIAELRFKWLKYHQAGDKLMCGIIERQAKVYKDSLEKLEKSAPQFLDEPTLEKTVETAEQIFNTK